MIYGLGFSFFICFNKNLISFVPEFFPGKKIIIYNLKQIL
jgi:hypothetical protein